MGVIEVDFLEGDFSLDEEVDFVFTEAVGVNGLAIAVVLVLGERGQFLKASHLPRGQHSESSQVVDLSVSELSDELLPETGDAVHVDD